MGDPLAPAVLRGFCMELVKRAEGPKLLGGIHYLAGRLTNPLEGWRMMGPAHALAQSETALGRKLSDAISRHYSPAKGNIGSLHIPGLGEARKALQGALGAGLHLEQPSTAIRGGGLRQAAEELSRRGWTGESRATKYLPFGEKTQATLGAAAMVPALAHAADPDSYRGPAETGLEGAATLGTGIATYGTGVYGMALPLMAGYAASRLGRRLDELSGRKPKNDQNLGGLITDPSAAHRSPFSAAGR